MFARIAVIGVSRRTQDEDLLASDPRLLTRAFWAEAADLRVAGVEISSGDAEDPLLSHDPGLAREIDARVGPLPAEARETWRRLKRG